jgi:SAM-dependent methyltransferase
VKNLAALSDEEWFDMLLRSVSDSYVNGLEFPTFPDKELQSNFVGSSNEVALNEGFAFYSLVKRYAASLGKPFDHATSRLLDFGCGWGRYLRIFRKDFAPDNMFGVDVDPDVLEICREHGVQGNLQAIEPLGHLPYQDDFFDCIIAYSVFTHLPEHIHLHWVREIYRATKPGGVFVLTLEPARFLDFVDGLGSSSADTPWHASLKQFAGQVPKLKSRYSSGEYIYIPTGGGDYRSADVYGEAVVPLKWLQRCWKGQFNIVRYIDDPDLFWQAVLVAQKPHTLGG